MLSKKFPIHFFAAVLAAFIWGFFSIPLRLLKDFPAQEILYYRIFTSLAIVLLISLFFRRNKIKTDLALVKQLNSKEKTKFYFQLLLSSVFITANWFSFIYVVNNVSLQSAAFAYMVCPIITAFFSFIILKETFTQQKFIALFISFLSVILLSYGFYQEVLYSIFIAVLYSFYLVIQKRMVAIDKFNFLLIQLLISFIIILPFYIATSKSVPDDSFFWIMTLLISVVFTIIPLFLSLYALIGISSSTMAIIIYLNPILAFSIAFLFYNEPATSTQVIAYIILLCAVILFNWQFLKTNFGFKPTI